MAKHYSYKQLVCYVSPELADALDEVFAAEEHCSQSAVLRKLLVFGLAVWRHEQRALRGEARARTIPG